jgi:hypothetical protein
VEHEISLFGGKNPVSGMLKTLQTLAAFLLSCSGFRESIILRNILVAFTLDYRKNESHLAAGLWLQARRPD